VLVLAVVEQEEEAIDATGRAVALGEQVAPGLEAGIDEEGAQAVIAVHRGTAEEGLA
jgi:hypothetical protein